MINQSQHQGPLHPQEAVAEDIKQRLLANQQGSWELNGSYLDLTLQDAKLQIGVFVREGATEISVSLSESDAQGVASQMSLSKEFRLPHHQVFSESDSLIDILHIALQQSNMEQDFLDAVSLNAVAENLLADIASEALDVNAYDWDYSIDPDVSPLGIRFYSSIDGCEVSLEYNPSYHAADYQIAVNPRGLLTDDTSLMPVDRSSWIASQALYRTTASEKGLEPLFQKLLTKYPEAASWLS